MDGADKEDTNNFMQINFKLYYYGQSLRKRYLLNTT